MNKRTHFWWYEQLCALQDAYDFWCWKVETVKGPERPAIAEQFWAVDNGLAEEPVYADE